MHAMMDGEGGSEPQDVFVELGTLIVEGRVPGGSGNGGGRGYTEGPHCSSQWHTCKPSSNFLCKRAENFRKHMLLLFQNKITMCIEVMLCADCVCGAHKAQSPEVAVVQSSCDLLLEQWTVTVVNTRPGEQPPMLARGLVQAVRSQLHFSQLSAWWSSSKGARPAHVSYRVTVPGEAFANQFQRQPDEHVFPLASVAKMAAIKVCVRSLPRMESVPAVACPVHGGGLGVGAPLGPVTGVSPSGPTTAPLGPALGPALGDPSLGECLLDPPQSYRSPPRIVHPDDQGVLIVRSRVLAEGNGRWSNERPPSPSPSPVPRMSAHSWRRPGHLYRPNDRRREAVCNASKQPCSRSPDDVRGLVDDRMQTACNQPGKHHCSCEGEEEEVPIASPTPTQVRQRRRSQVNSPPVMAPEPACPSPLPAPPPPLPLHDEPLSVRTGEPSSKWARTSPPSSPASSADEYLYVSDGSLAGPTLRLSERRPWAGVDSGRSSPSASPSPVAAADRGGASATTAPAAPAAAPSASKNVSRELDRELSPIELERVLSVLRDGKTPPIPSLEPIGPRTWCTSPAKLKDSDGDVGELAAVSPNCVPVFRVHPAASPSPSMPPAPHPSPPPPCAKADLFLAAILRAGRRSRPKAADALRTKRRDTKCESKCDNIKGDSAVIDTGAAVGRSADRTPGSSVIGKGPPEVRRPGLSQYSDLSGHKHMCHSPKAICDNCLCHCSPRGDAGGPCLALNTKDGRKVEAAPDADERPAKGRAKSKKGCSPGGAAAAVAAATTPGVPTASDRARFRQSFDSAASMVFHTRTGLPLTSSPAPLRRGTSRFDYDSSLNSVSAIRSALFESKCSVSSDDALSVSGDETESESGARSPCSPDAGAFPVPCHPTHSMSPCSSLLGSFEESVLNGRLEPVSTVQGFTAELGASGTFCPSHLKLPVTVFFYTLGNYDKVSTPYLGHINLGKKGYNVPRSGTIQVTLFNPMGTVIKMFVVVYDLLDMPPNSHTFLRQRTLYMPSKISDQEELRENAQKWLRYLIHLRFSSSKSGRIYLHTDIRMIIFRKSDMDTAAAHHNNNNNNNIISSSNIFDSGYEMRSFTDGPENPKFSPR